MEGGGNCYRCDKLVGVAGEICVYYAFMDLTKAFATAPKYKLFKKQRFVGIQGKMYRVIKDLYTNNKAKIRIGEYTSESLRIKSGVIQGSKVGTTLFNMP